MSNASEPCEPLISHWNAFRRPSAKPRRLDRPHRPALELDRGLERVVDLAARQERLHEAGDRRDLAGEEPRQVDDVRPEVAERPGAGFVGMEAPGVERRIVAPVLEVAPAEMADLAELAGVDHLAREPHRRHEAVVERAECLTPVAATLPPDLEALRRRRARAASRRSRACPPRPRRSSARRAASSARRCRTARCCRRRRAAASRRLRTRSRSAPRPRSRPARSARRCRRAAASSGGGHVM